MFVRINGHGVTFEADKDGIVHITINGDKGAVDPATWLKIVAETSAGIKVPDIEATIAAAVKDARDEAAKELDAFRLAKDAELTLVNGALDEVKAALVDKVAECEGLHSALDAFQPSTVADAIPAAETAPETAAKGQG